MCGIFGDLGIGRREGIVGVVSSDPDVLFFFT